MKIIVCAKQVPNTNEVKIDPVKGTLIRDGVESILNPDDANALEAALTLKDHLENCTVTVVSHGSGPGRRYAARMSGHGRRRRRADLRPVICRRRYLVHCQHHCHRHSISWRL